MQGHGFLFELQEGGIEIAKTDDTRINDEIRAPRVRLIGVDGSQLGLFDTRDAQRIADDHNLDLVEIAPNAEPPVCKVMDYGKFKYQQAMKAKQARKNQSKVEVDDHNLDLVEIAPNAEPPVCKVMDYGKFKYQQAMKAKQARKNQSKVEVKEMKFRPKIDVGDYETKKGHVLRFLKKGARVKINIMFRGREMAHPEQRDGPPGAGSERARAPRRGPQTVRYGRVPAQAGSPYHAHAARPDQGSLRQRGRRRAER